MNHRKELVDTLKYLKDNANNIYNEEDHKINNLIVIGFIVLGICLIGIAFINTHKEEIDILLNLLNEKTL